MWSDEVRKMCSLLHKNENVCGQKMPKYANVICESSLSGLMPNLVKQSWMFSNLESTFYLRNQGHLCKKK